MEPIRSSETSAIKTQTPGNYPKRNILQLKHGESLKTRLNISGVQLRCTLTMFTLGNKEILGFFVNKSESQSVSFMIST